MDPETILRNASYCAKCGLYDTVRDYLRDYWAWRDRGGFEPDRGDHRANLIAEGLPFSGAEQ